MTLVWNVPGERGGGQKRETGVRDIYLREFMIKMWALLFSRAVFLRASLSR